jgi:hypothetical protein
MKMFDQYTASNLNNRAARLLARSISVVRCSIRFVQMILKKRQRATKDSPSATSAGGDAYWVDQDKEFSGLEDY